jgi:hypothetical protein
LKLEIHRLDELQRILDSEYVFEIGCWETLGFGLSLRIDLVDTLLCLCEVFIK